jgi:hypothetical protein
MSGQIPLAPAEWFDRIARIDARLAARTIDIESGLRLAFNLLQIAPGPLSEMFAIDTSESQFESWLDDGAFDQAAKALVANHFPIEINMPDGHAAVTISAPWFGAKGEMAASRSSEAVLRAWLACLLDLQKKASAAFFSHADPALHGHQSELHRPSTMH